MYKTYSYKDMPVRKKPNQEHAESRPARDTKGEKKTDIDVPVDTKGIFGDIKNDDIILIAIALVLLADGCDDTLLLMAIAFIFLSDRM